MTPEDVRAIVAALVPEVRASVERLVAQGLATQALALKAAVDPLTGRLAAIEARPDPDPVPLVERAVATALGLMEGRLAALETRALVPGPPGKAGLTYCGVYVDGRSYDRGDGVTYAGSFWHCNTDGTRTKPGEGSSDWTLTVKRGRDGKDARP